MVGLTMVAHALWCCFIDTNERNKKQDLALFSFVTNSPDNKK